MDSVPTTETDPDHSALEAGQIAEAQASIAAGRYVDADEIDAWIDSIGTDAERPPPSTRHR